MLLLAKLKAYMHAYRVAKAACRNYFKLLLCAVLRREAIFHMRDGRSIRANGITLLRFLVHFPALRDFVVEGEIVKVLFFGSMIQFTADMLPYIWLDEAALKREYDVDVEGAVVLDVGAYIGDTPIYWVYRGASKVIAVEPVPQHYRLLVENCKGLPVIPILASVGSQVPELPDMIGSQSYGVRKAKGFEKYLDVQLLNFTQLVETWKPDVVKFNCEGCEHFIADELLSLPKLGVRKLILEIHNMGGSEHKELLHRLEQRFGTGRITYVIDDRAITVVWEFDNPRMTITT
ncbi:MAG: FkbM family methyltransferase [Candidatus Caldarchaeum sp.]